MMVRESPPLAVSRGTAGAELEADAALLGNLRADGPARTRWYVVSTPALVPGVAQRARAREVVDEDRCLAAGVELLERRAGGGLVLLDERVLCLTVALPAMHPLTTPDLTESYRWLGSALAEGLRSLGVVQARRVDVAQARERSAGLAEAAGRDPAMALVRSTCFAGISPYEVLVGTAKVVGLAQVRRREGALYQVGILLHDQSRIADLVRTADDAQRERLRSELRQRTTGLKQVQAREMPLQCLVDTLHAAVRAALNGPTASPGPPSGS